MKGLLIFLMSLCSFSVMAEETGPAFLADKPSQEQLMTTEMSASHDSVMTADTVKAVTMAKDKTAHQVHQRRDWTTWRPDVKKAMWYAIVLPGAGQIYNRKYWKLPIIYGGIVGCIYAMSWNGQQYKDYSQAYIDLMDNDPNTKSYEEFLHLGNKIDASNLSYYQQVFKNRKDKFRRWRDLSAFVLIGVYAISVIDAYVDASLSDFDISRDLSLHLEPAVIHGGGTYSSPLQNNALGINCCITF
ncbi:DUF5683 domain-containing protein [Prevotella sp. AGR2160]|uniref:DUF5683 domain-containing protein n=1 Tax=Prevotella sp. AGR2160 TaxID=1280674 RepID=UPI00041A7793|nr:DUF5683 domain-containing protein [Prevotella sp. AGR2160]